MNGEVWDQVKDRLNKRYNNKPVIMGLLESMIPQKSKETGLGVLELEFLVQSDYHKKELVSRKVLPQLREELAGVYKKPFGLNVRVSESKTPPSRVSSIAKFMQLPLDSVGKKKVGVFRQEFTFNSFVVGVGNEFAHAASRRVAEHPGDLKANPLFVFGKTGLGKTHLLHAVGNHLEETTSKKIVCVSAERFLNECVSGIRNKGMHRFRQKYRNDCHVLLIDDIHVLGRGEHAQEEFFHTLNSFFDTKRQVVVTCDRLPRDILGLKDRIRTRLEGGLIVDIQPPDLETKIAICKHKAGLLRVGLSEEAFYYVASICTNSVREIEGALKTLSFFAETGTLVGVKEAKRFLASQAFVPKKLTSDKIIKTTCDVFNLAVEDVKSKSRQKHLVIARQVGMMVLKNRLSISLKEIGGLFGKRDHSTVLNGIKKASLLVKSDLDIKEALEKIEKQLLKL